MHKTKIQGFTIVEVLTVVAVIGILATITYVTMSPDRRRNAAADVVKSSLQIVASDLKLQKSFDGGAPSLPDSYSASSENVVLNLAIATQDKYCLEGTHADYPEVKLYIDSTMSEAVEGACVPETLADDFNRSGSTLGTVPDTDNTVTWEALTGSWSTNGTKPALSSSPSNSPLAVVDYGRSNGDLKADVNVNDAIYFRVKDASNWWRVREATRTESYTYYTSEPYTYYTYDTYYTTTQGYCYKGSWNYNGRVYTEGHSPGSVIPSGKVSTGYCYSADEYPGWNGTGAATRKTVVTSSPVTCEPPYTTCYWGDSYSRTVYNVADSTSSYTVSTPHTGYQQVAHTGYNYYYNLVLEKSVNGTISQVWAQPETTTRPPLARVVLNGDSIAVYSSTSGSALTTVTDSYNRSATKHGIGRATNSTSGIGLDNFLLKQ